MLVIEFTKKMSSVSNVVCVDQVGYTHYSDVSGLRGCDIYPFDPNTIPEEVFLPSTAASEIPLGSALPADNNVNVDEHQPRKLGLNRSDVRSIITTSLDAV